MVAILELSNTAITALAASQTPAVYTQALDQLISATAARTRASLSELQHGEGQAESLPIHCCLEETDLHVTVRARVSDEAVTLDFSGSSPAAKGFVNTTAATTLAAAAILFFLPLARRCLQ